MRSIRISDALLFLVVALVVAAAASAAPNQSNCSTCHADIFEKYRQTGMGRSFFVPSPSTTIEDYSVNNRYFHAPSAIHYLMTRHDGGYYQKHFQIGLSGEETNAVEERIDYVLGSGNHARTYLHRTAQGTLVQLPLGWYAEKGGYWAMSPGYDVADHPGSRRPIGSDCMFCHNAYPNDAKSLDRFGEVPVFNPGLPQGIDCQRCHFSSTKHAVNPAALSPERSMEVCLQCHLEPDSLNPTLNFKRYGKNWFSYTPGEPLPDFMLFFDTAASGSDDRFQIAGTAYQFRKSSCFVKSNGKFQCTTCHDPHQAQHGNEASAHYNAVCVNCHSQLIKHAVTQTDCVSCHMQKRRTTDVVHVVMTDHYIRPAPISGDLLADRSEQHGAPGPVPSTRPYYPSSMNAPLYSALSRVKTGADPAAAIPVIRAARPQLPDPWFEVAEAEHRLGHTNQAIAAYRACLALDPRYLPALLGLGATLRDSGQPVLSTQTYTRALSIAPADPRAWNSLGQVQVDLKKLPEASASFQKAAELDPSMPDPHNWLGILAAQAGKPEEAEDQFRVALKLQPNYPEAHANLANLLSLRGYSAMAALEFESSLSIKPGDAHVRMHFAALLNSLGRYDEAIRQMEAALESNPRIPDGHDLLGNTLERVGRRTLALEEYRKAILVDPDSLRAHLDLGAVLLAEGNPTESAAHLRRAATSKDGNIRALALQLLETPGTRRR